MNPTGIGVFVGVDIAKEEHFCQAIGAEGAEMFARAVSNNEADLEQMID